MSDGNGDRARRALTARLRELIQREARIAVHLRGDDGRRGADPEDAASLLANDEVLQGLDDVARAEVREIRDAIARLDAGRYGTCERCRSPIPADRLRALPHVRWCTACALRDEADRAA